jgi:hypothetical protein
MVESRHSVTLGNSFKKKNGVRRRALTIFGETKRRTPQIRKGIDHEMHQTHEQKPGIRPDS